MDRTIDLTPISSFHPPKRTLMGPGPSDIHPRVLAATARPVIGHLDPSFSVMMEELKELLRYAFQTSNALTIPISAPGSAGMEACFVNLIEARDSVIVCENGVFGARMAENVRRCGANPIVVKDAWGAPVTLEKVEDAVKSNPDAKALAFVHAETSTGVISDAAALCQMAQNANCLSIVDTVTSLGGIPVLVDEWGADAVYSGTQKCLSCPPGLSPVTFSEKAVNLMKGRNTKVQSWFLDLNLIMGYWDGTSKRSYHHTAPINSLYALHESLVMVREEGLKNAWERHLKCHLALCAGIEAMGLSLFVEKESRLFPLNSISIPEGVDEGRVRANLLAQYNLEIGAGLGDLAGKVWRIGLMGQSATAANVLLCLNALEETLVEMGALGVSGQAAKAAKSILFSRSE
jgi:alanine-glyoxylate transaminase / serine-glyoxylate transaminase / serine-pyruvate transaminase